MIKPSRIAFMAITTTLVIACTPRKEAAVAPPPAVVPEQQPALSADVYYTGKVSTAFAGESCPLLVEVNEQDGVILIPIGLAPQFATDGLQIRFKYRLSRANNGGCTKGQTAILEDVAIARKSDGSNKVRVDQ